jgi:uncharacterized protein involved in outer membrane biogenesis
MSPVVKRLAWFLGAAALLAAACVLIVFALIPREMLKTRIGEQIAGWTGRPVTLGGEPRIGLFPLSVTLDDVAVGGPAEMGDAEIISMDRLTGRVRLIPLLIGRVEIDSFTMVRPLVRLVSDEEGRRNWEFDSGAAALQLAFAGDVPLGEFRLEGGTLAYENRRTGESERLDSVNLSIEWESVRNPIAIEGSGIWRGEAVSFSANAAAPFAYLNGASTPVEAGIDAAPIGAVLSGEASDYPDLRLSGALRLSTPSLRRFAAWLGSGVGPGSTLGQASLFGIATLTGNVLSVADAEFTLDGNRATGALSITAGAAPDITGTLAFGALDLSPYFAGLSAAISLGPDWRRVDLPTDGFGNMSADVRLSADSVKLGDLDLGGTAASVSLRDRRLEVGLARASLGTGSIAGDLTIVDSITGIGAAVAAQLRATEIDLSEAAPVVGFSDTFSGTATVALDVTAEGRDIGALVESLGGTAELRVADGVVPLFGLPEIVAGGVPAPANAFHPSAIRSASLGLSFVGGVGTIEQASVVTSAYSATANGRIGLFDGGLKLVGTVKTGAPGAADGAESPFIIEGTLASPVARRQAMAN